MLSSARTIRRRPLQLAQRRHFQFTRTPEPTPPEVAVLLANYAERGPRPTMLSTLLSFGRPLTPQSIIASASYILEELPRRLVHRVRALDALPFIVGTNPFIARTHNLYKSSFQALATHDPVRNLDANWAFTRQLEGLVESHANDIPTMAKGFQECAKYMTPAEISFFLDGAIRSRIGVRLLAEHHIALSRSLQLGQFSDNHVGIVDMACSPKEMINMCASFVKELCEGTLGASPPLIIEGHTDSTFAYVPVHVEYILTEILKNSFRASVEHHHSLHGSSSTKPIPPVLITISPSPRVPESNRSSFMNLRIRDQGGGVSPANASRIFSYAFTTAGRKGEREDDDEESGGGPYAAQHIGGIAAVGGDGGAGQGNVFGEINAKGLQTGLGTIAGLGYGLPLAKLYAGYFGGSLELVSLYGHGTDVFIKLRCLDEGGDVPI